MSSAPCSRWPARTRADRRGAGERGRQPARRARADPRAGRSMTALVLAAPLAGWATRLEEIPDPAFAQGVVGDGVAIDPTSSELCAPCDGVVVSVHRARHACTVRADGGAEIL